MGFLECWAYISRNVVEKVYKCKYLDAHVSAYLPVCLSICLPACLPVFVCLSLSVCMSVCVSACLPVCLLRPSVCLSVFLSFFERSVYRSVYPFIHSSAQPAPTCSPELQHTLCCASCVLLDRDNQGSAGSQAYALIPGPAEFCLNAPARPPSHPSIQLSIFTYMTCTYMYICAYEYVYIYIYLWLPGRYIFLLFG